MTERVLDLRTYRLVPGGRAEFDRILREEALPRLEARGIEVVGFGPSLLGDRHYTLLRAFASELEREQALSEFYGSEEWQSHAAAVDELVESFYHLVLPAGVLEASG